MRHDRAEHLTWRKSSYTNSGGNDCVEVADTGSGTAVRDSKNRAAGHLTVSAPGWRALLDRLG